jgi:hypothetical protein
MILGLMKALRQVLVLLLLLALPFQAALGASAAACVQAAHHGPRTLSASADHGSIFVGRVDAAWAVGPSDPDVMRSDAAAQSIDGGVAPHDHASGRCSSCSSCCVSEAAMPDKAVLAVMPDVRFAAIPVFDDPRVSALVDPLFRPPRSTTL